MEIIFLFLISMLGAFITGVTGFGYAIICISLLPLVMELKVAVIIVLISSIVLFIYLLYQLIWRIKVKISYRLILLPLGGIFIGRFLGIYMLTRFEDVILIPVLCVLLVILSLYFARYAKKFKIAFNRRNALLAGLISGVFGGVYNIGGPPLVVYYFSSTETNNQYNAHLQATLLISALYSLVLHTLIGNINTEVLILSSISILGVISGIYFGFRIFKSMNRAVLNMVISVFIILTSIVLAIKYFWG